MNQVRDEHKSRQELLEELTALRQRVSEIERLQTDCQRTAQALHESEKRFALFMQHLPGAAFIQDSEGRLVYANDVALKTFGLDAKEVIGRPLSEIFPSEKAGKWVEEDREILLGAKPLSYEETVEQEAGRSHWLTYKFPILGEGMLPMVGGVAIDISAHRRDEEQLRKLSRAVEASPALVMITDADGVIEYLNPKSQSITGYAPEELLGRNAAELGEQGAEEMQAMWTVLNAGQEWRGEFRNRRKSGEFYDEASSISSIRDASGKVTHYVKVAEDVTPLREMDRIKREFLATAAHELRTPLTSVMGFAELMMESEESGRFDPDQRREFLAEIYSKGEVLNTIIDNLLDIGRIEAGRPIHLEAALCDLQGAFAKVVGHYRVQAPGHRIEPFLPERALPEFLADRNRMEQVLENLLSNAVKYSPNGGRIRLTCAPDGDFYRFELADEGVGMTPEQVSRVFDKFYRADASHTAVSGWGLGMSIAKQIVEGHGGRIWVESEPGRGTVVQFTLPLPA